MSCSIAFDFIDKNFLIVKFEGFCFSSSLQSAIFSFIGIKPK